MGVGANNTRPEEVAWRHPGRVSTYRIYPGGKQYRADVLGWGQRAVAWRPNGERNPLGIYCRSGTIRLYDEVTIEGTLIVEGGSSGDAHVQGAEVYLRPHNLPPLYGSDRPIRLPVAVIEDDLRIHKQARVSVTGLLAVGEDFEIRQARQEAIEMTIQGAVVARNVLIHPRREWYQERRRLVAGGARGLPRPAERPEEVRRDALLPRMACPELRAGLDRAPGDPAGAAGAGRARAPLPLEKPV